MPLPALLLERLKRRKVIQDIASGNESAPQFSSTSKLHERASSSNHTTNKSKKSRANSNSEGQEEIIAEDYSSSSSSSSEEDEPEEIKPENSKLDNTNLSSGDKNLINQDSNEFERDKLPLNEKSTGTDSKDSGSNKQATASVTSQDKRFDLPIGQSIVACPNKYNIYHECSQYCMDNYGNTPATLPSLGLRKQLAFILKRYPLTSNWTVVYDPGLETFYFWNTITNLVSWLPPTMGSIVSLPAEQIRRSLSGSQSDHHHQQLPFLTQAHATS